MEKGKWICTGFLEYLSTCIDYMYWPTIALVPVSLAWQIAYHHDHSELLLWYMTCLFQARSWVCLSAPMGNWHVPYLMTRRWKSLMSSTLVRLTLPSVRLSFLLRDEILDSIAIQPYTRELRAVMYNFVHTCTTLYTCTVIPSWSWNVLILFLKTKGKKR